LIAQLIYYIDWRTKTGKKKQSGGSRGGSDVTSYPSNITMPPIPWRVNTTNHPGSSQDDIEKEPDWQAEHQHEHRIGYKNRYDRRPGVTHEEDEHTEAQDLAEVAQKGYDRIVKKEKQGDLVNFRDIVLNEKDLHLRHPENRSLGWRFVLQCSEDYVKNKEDWPANVQKRQKEEEAQKKKASKQNEDAKSSEQGDGSLDEEKWKREIGEGNKHHDAYAGSAEDSGYSSDESNKQKTEYEKLRERYSSQEIALLRALQHEKDYIQNLKQNDGKLKSPQTQNRTTISIDEADQFSPDNWLPRSSTFNAFQCRTHHT
jgi:nitrate reductase (NAD(P)H)